MRGAVTRQVSGIGRGAVGAATRNCLRNSFGERRAAAVEPIAIDHQGVGVAGFKGGSGFGAGRQAALDAAGIEQHGEARAVAVPKFLVEFQERKRDGDAVAQQVNVLPGIALLHGRGKIDVKLQRVFRKDVGGGVDVRHAGGGGRGGGCRDIEDRLDERAAGRRKTARTCMPGESGKRGRNTSAPPSHEYEPRSGGTSPAPA